MLLLNSTIFNVLGTCSSKICKHLLQHILWNFFLEWLLLFLISSRELVLRFSCSSQQLIMIVHIKMHSSNLKLGVNCTLSFSLRLKSEVPMNSLEWNYTFRLDFDANFAEMVVNTKKFHRKRIWKDENTVKLA